ncbi:MAG TPA: riboflavin synthase [Burkholderiales bacterium]|nr:riboflavin synthase [Burkholderiales bacterium]
MFTGIIAAVGRIAEVRPAPGGVRLRIDAGGLPLGDVALGDSIAVSGVCLTVVAAVAASFEVDVSQETLACAAGFEAGAAVNLEKALRLADRLGGHLVSGHVDGRGRVERFDLVGDNRVLDVTVPQELSRYIARKGSVAIDGVSLTVNSVEGARFSVNLIPHTLAHTNFARLAPGVVVNIEIDLIARYIERMNAAGE